MRSAEAPPASHAAAIARMLPSMAAVLLVMTVGRYAVTPAPANSWLTCSTPAGVIVSEQKSMPE